MGAENPIRILTVDDHPVLREGIAAILASESDMVLVAEAGNGREAIEQFRTHRPDIRLMDLQMPLREFVLSRISCEVDRNPTPGSRTAGSYSATATLARLKYAHARSLESGAFRADRPHELDTPAYLGRSKNGLS